MTANLCPACGDDLPAGYPYDHVVFDAVLRGRPGITIHDRAEQAEAIRIGLARGMSLMAIANKLRISYAHAQDVAGRTGIRSTRQAEFDATVARMAAAGYTAHGIASLTGHDRNAVRRSMDRQGLGEQEVPAA